MNRLLRDNDVRMWVLLSGWAALSVIPHLGNIGRSWHFFQLGSQLLFADRGTGTGLALYASHPSLQIGPLALIAAALLRAVDPQSGEVAAVIVMTVLGPVLLWLISRLQIRGLPRTPARSVAFAGLLFLPLWAEVSAHFAHLDDVLALTFTVLAFHSVETDRPVASGLLLACAADSKPWAAAFIPLVLVLAPAQRRRALAVWGAGLLLAWLPFLLDTSNTLHATAFAIPNTASSALRALGIADPQTPVWDRPVQLILGAFVAFLCVRARRWPAVPFGVIAVRLLLDPATYSYYTSGLVLAAVLVDLFIVRARVPYYALSAVIVVYALRATPLDFEALGQTRAAYCVAAIAFLFVPGVARITRAPRLGGGHQPASQPVALQKAGASID